MGIKRNNMTRKSLIVCLLTILTLTSCVDEKEPRQFSFNATVEQLDDNGTKVRLVNERYIYWELDDRVNIASNTTSRGANQPTGFMASSEHSEDFHDSYNGVFVIELPWDSEYFLGLHPASSGNIINPEGNGTANFTAQINLPSTQPYRNDVTFGKNVMPMVAWYGGEWDDNYNGTSTPFNLDFHSLGGIVRFQFCNATNATGYTPATDTINSITITSSDKQLCGLFTVNDYKTYNPSLTATDNSSNRTITIGMPEGGLPFAPNDLLSFYVVLPSLRGSDDRDTYTLTVTLTTQEGTLTKSNVTVPIRRNGITYMSTIRILNFQTMQNEESIVGNGTMDRPFKIYTYKHLQALRNAFIYKIDGEVYINGQKVTDTTQFRIMRSDIMLTTTNWTGRGIPDFKGKMTYAANATRDVLHGITNHSNLPLFESISTEGEVNGLTIKCSHQTSNSDPFSLFCGTNNGTIKDCHITTPYTTELGSYLNFYGLDNTFAGICCINNGTIDGCSCSLLARIQGNFAGICHQNNGTIRGCIAAAPMTVYNATNAAGICYENNSLVEDCYFDAQYLSENFVSSVVTNWGGIVYTNNGSSATVRHCYVSAGAIIHSTTVGGIVCNNYNGGTVDYCWCNGELRGTKVGGIAATQSGTGGSKIINCFIDDYLSVITLYASANAHYAGGLVAELSSGQLLNSYALINRIEPQDNTGVYGNAVGLVGMSATVSNCYAYSKSLVDVAPRFYGSVASGGTLTNAYLINGIAQDGVNAVANNAAGLSSLLTNLHTNYSGYSGITGAKDWVSGTTIDGLTYPALSPYTISPAKKKTKHRR